MVEGADVLDLGVVGRSELARAAGDLGDRVEGVAPGELVREAFDATVTAVEAVATRFDVPVAVTVGAGVEPASTDLADLAGAGVDVIRGTQDLAGAAALGLSVVLASPTTLPAAQAAGLGRERIVLDAGLAAGGHREPDRASSSADVDRLVAFGCAVLLDVPPELPVVAAWASGLARGCRVLRTPDVRAARRTADVLAAILGARSEVRR